MLKGYGERIRKTRESRGLSQSDLAEKINSDKALISRYENEKILPSGRMFVKIANALNVEVDYLCGQTPESEGLTFYSDYYNKSVVGKISPLDIPDNSDYFSLQAEENYCCGVEKEDLLIFRPENSPTSGEMVLVERKPNKLLLGMLIADRGQKWLIIGNAQQPIDISDENEFKIVAELVYSVKDFGRYK